MTQSHKINSPLVPLDEIERYFDGSTRDRIDLTGHSRRAADLLQLREMVLRLPEDAYDATIAAMKGLLQQATTGQNARADSQKSNRSEASKRFLEAVRPSTSATSSSGAHTKQVSKV